LENSYQYDTKYKFDTYDYYQIPAGDTTYKLKCKYTPPSLDGGIIDGRGVEAISSINTDIVVGNPYPFMRDDAFEAGYRHSPEKMPPIILTNYRSSCGGNQVFDHKFDEGRNNVNNANNYCNPVEWKAGGNNGCRERGFCFKRGLGTSNGYYCDHKEECYEKYNFRGNLVKIVRLPDMAKDQFIISYVQTVKDHSNKLYYLSMNDEAAKILNEQNGGGTGISQQAVCLRITDNTTPANTTVAAYSKWKMDTSGRIHLVLNRTDNYCLKAFGRELHLALCNYSTFSDNTGFYLLFKQGSLELADFSIAVPTTNETVAVNSVNINNDDI
jgi:hypothetical protein